jgi:hypothetical protein
MVKPTMLRMARIGVFNALSWAGAKAEFRGSHSHRPRPLAKGFPHVE